MYEKEFTKNTGLYTSLFKIWLTYCVSHLENNTYTYKQNAVISVQHSTHSPSWNWWAILTLWASVPHSAIAYWTSSQTDPRQFRLAVTPPLCWCSTLEPPRAVCSAPSCSPCSTMTQTSGELIVKYVDDTIILSQSWIMVHRGKSVTPRQQN